MKSFAKLLLFIALLFILDSSSAQFIGTGSPTDFTLASEIKKKALRLDWTDQIIKVKGFIVEQFGKHYYWFEDKTGRIKIEITSKHMPAVPFDRNTEVVIYGEVDFYLFGRTEIEVEKIEFK
jgi:uncharacterized protein (TIGR00156 family)